MNMKTFTTLAALAAAFALAGSAARADTKDLVRSHACFTCHAVSGTKVGPGFEEIAAKFAGKADAEKTLIDAMEHGEKGTFGAMPMPANSSLTDAEAKQIAEWILGQKK